MPWCVSLNFCSQASDCPTHSLLISHATISFSPNTMAALCLSTFCPFGELLHILQGPVQMLPLRPFLLSHFCASTALAFITLHSNNLCAFCPVEHVLYPWMTCPVLSLYLLSTGSGTNWRSLYLACIILWLQLPPTLCGTFLRADGKIPGALSYLSIEFFHFTTRKLRLREGKHSQRKLLSNRAWNSDHLTPQAWTCCAKGIVRNSRATEFTISQLNWGP